MQIQARWLRATHLTPLLWKRGPPWALDSRTTSQGTEALLVHKARIKTNSISYFYQWQASEIAAALLGAIQPILQPSEKHWDASRDSLDKMPILSSSQCRAGSPRFGVLKTEVSTKVALLLSTKFSGTVHCCNEIIMFFNRWTKRQLYALTTGLSLGHCRAESQLYTNLPSLKWKAETSCKLEAPLGVKAVPR